MLGQGLFAESVGQALIQSGVGAPCRGHGFLAAAGQSDAADPGVCSIGPALAVAEAFELCHSFGGALLGHAQVCGQFANRGLVVDQALNDVAVRETQIGEPVLCQLLPNQQSGAMADKERERSGVQLMRVERGLHERILHSTTTVVQLQLSNMSLQERLNTIVRYHQAVCGFASSKELSAFIHPTF
jgi:hypothetical protein